MHHEIKVNLLIVYYLIHGVGSFLRSSGSQLFKKFTSCYGTQRFNTTLTSAHHLSLAWAKINPVQWSPIPLPEDTSFWGWKTRFVFLDLSYCFKFILVQEISIWFHGDWCDRILFWKFHIPKWVKLLSFVRLFIGNSLFLSDNLLWNLQYCIVVCTKSCKYRVVFFTIYFVIF